MIVRNNLNSVYLKNSNYLFMPVVKILTGLSNSQNLSNASNVFLLFVGCVSIFVFLLAQLVRNMHSTMIEV